MTNFEKFPIDEPINEGVEEAIVSQEDGVSTEETIEQTPTPTTLVDKKEEVGSGIDWLGSDKETSKTLAHSDIEREYDIKIMQLGMEEIRKRNIDTSDFSSEKLDSMIKLLGGEILADRNHEWSIQKEESFKQAKEEYDEEVRRRRLEKAQNTFPDKVRNFLSKDLFGFLKRK